VPLAAARAGAEYIVASVGRRGDERIRYFWCGRRDSWRSMSRGRCLDRCGVQFGYELVDGIDLKFPPANPGWRRGSRRPLNWLAGERSMASCAGHASPESRG
jgi:hypothetical protein